MPILNYTTTVAAIRSASQVQERLAKHGAATVSIAYANGRPTAVAFGIETEHGPRSFKMPVNVKGVHGAMQRDRSVPQRFRNLDQAERVAWRICKDWVEVQIALIESGMSRLDEVMLPFMVVGDGLTLSEKYQSSTGMRQAIEA